MESLYLLIPISIIFIVIALSLYFWAVNSGQYDDLDAEGERLLFDNEDGIVLENVSVTVSENAPENFAEVDPENVPGIEKLADKTDRGKSSD